MKRTARQLLQTKRPINTTIQLRSKDSIRALAHLREMNVSLSGTMDALLAANVEQILKCRGRELKTISATITLPTQGLR